MNSNDLKDIVAIIDKIKEDTLFVSYRVMLKNLEDNDEKIKLVEQYKQAQDAYTQSRQSQYAIENLRNAKAKLDEQIELKELFRIIRRVEFFIDDLNYSINKQITSKKSSCK